jgi:hypothetical protein
LLLQCATSVGYRESGLSISGAATPREKIIVAIRTTAIRLDIPLASCDTNSIIRPFGLTGEYLETLFILVNDKFDENEARKQSLLASLRRAFVSHQTQAVLQQIPSETKDQRRIRKRIEGLKLQETSSRVKENTNEDDEDPDDILDGLLHPTLDTP